MLPKLRSGWQAYSVPPSANRRPQVGSRSPSRRGRRRETGSHPIFQDFVFELLNVAGSFGGGFSFDKNYETGTLLEAIEVLKPYLPPGVVPKVIPLPTIQRIVTRYRKARDQYACLEK